MSKYRDWDETKSPQWKYLFQKESLNRRKTRKDLDRERKWIRPRGSNGRMEEITSINEIVKEEMKKLTNEENNN